jgi:hypothetical protein
VPEWHLAAPGGKIGEERMARLRHFLRVSRHIELPGARSGLERHLENESLKGQLSGLDFYDLDFGGR